MHSSFSSSRNATFTGNTNDYMEIDTNAFSSSIERKSGHYKTQVLHPTLQTNTFISTGANEPTKPSPFTHGNNKLMQSEKSSVLTSNLSVHEED